MYLTIVSTLIYVILAFILSMMYLKRYAVTRPPIGIINLGDIVSLIVVIILMHYLSTILPLWIPVGMLFLASFSILYSTVEPILENRWLSWTVVMALISADVGTIYWFGGSSGQFYFVNSTVLTVINIGIANLWVQGGMKTRDAAILAGAIAIFDYVATAQTNLMNNVVDRLANVPFAPFITGVGFGDMLFTTFFALLMYKAFGQLAGITSVLISSVILSALLLLIAVGFLGPSVPLMTPLGPLMVLQYLYWRQRRGVERTMWQYLQAEAVPNKYISPVQ